MLTASLKSKPGKHIYCDKGAEIVQEIAQHQLIDEYIIPILLGGGIRLFKDGRSAQKLTLLSARSFKKVLLQVHYKTKK